MLTICELSPELGQEGEPAGVLKKGRLERGIDVVELQQASLDAGQMRKTSGQISFKPYFLFCVCVGLEEEWPRTRLTFDKEILC